MAMMLCLRHASRRGCFVHIKINSMWLHAMHSCVLFAKYNVALAYIVIAYIPRPRPCREHGRGHGHIVIERTDKIIFIHVFRKNLPHL